MTGHSSPGRRPVLSRSRVLLVLLCAALSGRVCGQIPGGDTGERPRADRLGGKVTDASTGLPIPAVNVRILGTSRGTVSNADGRYSLPIEAGRQTVVFIHLAYESDTIEIVSPGPQPAGAPGEEARAPGEKAPGEADLRRGAIVRDVALRPATIVYPEVLVLAEDPALEIIRKAIENKHRWMDLLKTYRFDAYTRQVIDRDTSVASITEAFSTGWALSGDTIRERVIQKRQTANVPMEDNFAAVRRLVNFNDDRITLFTVNMNSERRAFTFTGPTAPDALDNYDYRLLKTRRLNGIEMYEIAMTPKTRLKPLFSGTITIADRSFAVAGVDLEPNETFTIPFVKGIVLRYRQQFALYDSLFWMPADIRIDGGFEVNVMGISLPRIGFRQVSSIYNYELNAPVPDSVLARRSLTVDSAATATYDSSYWSSNLVVPLTEDETKAYTTLDSTQTLERQFRPGGIVGALADDDDGSSASLPGIVDVRFNRVEGLYLGAGEEFRSLIPQAVIGLAIGYPFSDRRVEYAASVSFRPAAARWFTAGAGAYRRAERTPDGGYYPAIVNSLTSLFDKNDYFDYYRAEGFTLWVDYAAGRRFRTRLSFVSQEESAMPVATDYSWVSRDGPFRENPAAAPGTRRSLGVTVRFGLEREDLDIITNNNLEITAERSSPSLFASDFDYTRVSSLLTYTIPLFAKDLLFPASFRLRAFAGKGFGTLPPQQAFAADTRLSGLALFGTLRTGFVKEYTGDAVVSIALEQNFRSLPFLALNIPFLYRNGIELLVHGAFARAWRGDTPTTGGWHSEAGVGIGRILDLLRIDLTRRFREPARFFVTLGISSFL